MKEQYTRYSLQGHLLVISNHVNVPTSFKSPGWRKQVTGFSKSSSWRMRRYLRTCRANYDALITLTYPEGYPSDGRVFKEHLRRFLQECSRENQRIFNRTDGGVSPDSFSCFWFMEFQSRGAAHFHIFTNGRFPKQWIAKRWFDIVGSDDLRHYRAGTRIEKIRAGRRGTVAYAGKYAAKTEQKDVPEWVKNAGRFWGITGDRLAVSADTLVTPDEKAIPSVARALKTLKKITMTLNGAGKLRVLKKDFAVLMYSTTEAGTKELFEACLMLQIAVAQHSKLSFIEMPHHECTFDAHQVL